MNNNSKDEAKALAEGKKSSNVGTLQDIELGVVTGGLWNLSSMITSSTMTSSVITKFEQLQAAYDGNLHG